MKGFLNFLSVTGVYMCLWSASLLLVLAGVLIYDTIFPGTNHVLSVETVWYCLIASLIVEHVFKINKPH